MYSLTHLPVSQEVKSNVESGSPSCIARNQEQYTVWLTFLYRKKSREIYSLAHLSVSQVKSNVESDSPSCIARSREQSARFATCETASGLSPEAETIQTLNYFHNKA